MGGSASYIADARGVIARARGMTEVAREAGVTREALYKSLSGEDDPRLTTLLGVARAGCHAECSYRRSALTGGRD